jgi:cyclic 2,3-diphosphoglycerate synthetase
LASQGKEVAAAVLVGGREKLPAEGVEAYGGVLVRTGDDARLTLAEAIEEFSPEGVIDLSDEPVLDYRKRLELASIALYLGVPYSGADFLLRPPSQEHLSRKPVLSIIGTGKRTGKTAVAGYVARLLKKHGREPVIVAMGRGGPPEPEVLKGGEIEMTPEDLMALVKAGKHAASDYVEDAVLGRVTTVGCRRCGGGLAGGVEISNVQQGVKIADGLDGDLLLMEGSGSAIPPVGADAYGLVIPASIPLEYAAGYLGPYRFLLADFVVVTMCEEPFGSPSKISSLTSQIRSAWRYRKKARDGKPGDRESEIEVVRTVFRPTPTRSVDGATVFVATTAPEAAGGPIVRHLEEQHGCRVAGITHSLSDRQKLTRELEGIGNKADVLLCEIKAAGIDVATRRGLDEGLDVVYMDNLPQGVEGDELEPVVLRAAELADARSRDRSDR